MLVNTQCYFNQYKTKKWKTRNDDSCSYCNESIDTLVHYACDCKLDEEVIATTGEILNMKDELQSDIYKYIYIYKRQTFHSNAYIER